MWTTEFEDDNTIITVLDDKGGEEDVILEMDVDHVDIRQFNNTLGYFDIVSLTPKMMFELIEAFQRPEGLFTSEEKYGLPK